MKQINKIIPILTVMLLMFFLLGCGKQKHRLNFDSYGFESKKSEYAYGDKVKVYYNLIGTDTDYNFYLDDESIELKQSYDDKHGYILTFTMPDHDVTLNVNSHNNMVYIPQINVTFVNEVKESDIWVLPQTEENTNSTWGNATISKLPVNEEREISLQENRDAESWIINIIAGYQYYSVSDIALKEGYTIIFKTETKEYNGIQHKNEFIEILDQNGNLLSKNEDIFIGSLGAK
ncbi:putative lipoprotein [Peptoanaerobacter stomatis]|jgi:lipoprotein|uniref:Putative lipoprotein n=1 Tax=Peptoanaerobacter stomatis TaxID=796937 RepID=J6HC58_9FIRM|nr:hypothetical protein [Peptoanaerobacter stomatis]EJU20403.1 putative lipoprotein [Peptoanaerobacter stomatis]NWO25689.1 hypothetical protein [Peptostreptococcaceae bacterium oral taxon 081]